MAGPDLRQMRYLVKVADAGSFTAAAADLFVAQQAVSQQVKTMETMLGVTLLRRGPRGVTPTAAGAAFLVEARRLVDAADRLAEQTRAAARGEVGTVRFGYSDATSGDTLPQILAAAAEELPNLTVATREVIDGEIGSLFGDAVVDVAVLPHSSLGPELAWRRLRDEPLVVALGRSHPLAGAPVVGFADLRGERFVHWPRRKYPAYYHLVVGGCREAGFEPAIDVCSSWGGVAAGRVVTLVAASMAAVLPPGITLVPLRERLVLPISIMWRPDRAGAVVERIVSLAEAVATRQEWL